MLTTSIEPAAPRRPFLWILVAGTMVLGLAWLLLVPPFESSDESAFYKEVTSYARGGPITIPPLYPAVLKPVIKLAGGSDRPFQAEYNPSFRFVSNRVGHVNMYMHGRAAGMLRADVNRMYLLRFVTLLMWLASLVLIFEIARLFFGRGDLALVTAGLCLAIPQFSFFSSKIHAEATATLLASIVYYALAARVYGRIGRAATWAMVLTAVVLAPLSDRQAYFLLLLGPFGLLAVERTWRARGIAALALVVPVLLVMTLPQFDRVQVDLKVTAFGMFSSAYRGGYWNEDNLRYLAYEFLPKLFFSFCGWLGQPSILLPPWVYAALAVLFLLGIAGMLVPDTWRSLTVRQRRLVWILGAGFIFMLAPIVYANLFISRNSWHGRWLFPSVAPIMIALVAGFRTFAKRVDERPWLVAGIVGGAALVLAVAWMTPIGEAVRTGVRGNHYGDQAHVIRTIADIIPAMGVAALVAGLAAVASRWRSTVRRPTGVGLVATAWGLNLLLLAAFVVPLYQPLDAAGFAAAARSEAAQGELGRASRLYRLGIAAHPTSTELRRLANDLPEMFVVGDDDQMLAELQARIGRGEKIRSWAALMGLARVARTKGGVEPAVLRAILGQSEDAPELAEPRALVRAQLEGTTHEPSLAIDVIRAGNGVHSPFKIRDEASVEGFTVHELPSGHNELVLYFRPLRNWSGRRLWFYAYPLDSDAYLTVEAEPAAFSGWTEGELAWEVFTFPAAVRYKCAVGIAVGSYMGGGYHIGVIGR